MVSSVNNISAEQVFKPLTSEAINAPHRTQGIYAAPQNDSVELTAGKSEKKPKKNKFWRGLGKLIVLAAVVGGGLYGSNKAGWLDKTEKYGVKHLKKAATWVDKVVVEKGIKQAYTWVKTKLAPKAKEVADDAEKVVKEAAEEAK